MIELKAEKQRADQQAGLKPKPQPSMRTMDEDDATSNVQAWLLRNKPIVSFAAAAFLAVVVQSLGIVDVKQAVLTLLSPITTATYKARLSTGVVLKTHCRPTQCSGFSSAHHQQDAAHEYFCPQVYSRTA